MRKVALVGLVVAIVALFVAGLSRLFEVPSTSPQDALDAAESVRPRGDDVGLVEVDSRSDDRTRGSNAADPPRVTGASASANEPPDPIEPGGLRVRVVDANGSPVPGVDVQLRMAVAGMGEDGRGRATTRAPDGLARIPLSDDGDPRSFADMRKQVEAMGIDVDFLVLADVATRTPVRTALDGWPEDGDEVTLTLGATGSLRVRVFLPDGTAAPDDATVYWWWLPADVAAEQENPSFDRLGDHTVGVRDGVAIVDGLGLGLALRANAHLGGYSTTATSLVTGPTSPGEVVEADVTLGAPLATLRLRVLDPRGRPVASERLSSARWDDPDRERHPASGPPRPSWKTIETDERGVATFQHAPGSVEFERRLDVTRKETKRSDGDASTWARGSTWLPRELVSGEVHDLGDVRLVPPRVLAAGHVVDAAGAPVVGASLRFRERFGTSAQHRWYNLEKGSLKSGANGEFELLAFDEPLQLGVGVTHRSHAPRTLEAIAVGDTRLVLEMGASGERAPAGSIEVEVTLDEGVPFMRCLLKFRREGGGGRSPDWWAGAPLTVGHLRPGTYDVFVETRDGDFELGRVSGVLVEDDEVTRDPRLLPFDLTGTAAWRELLVTRPGGAPRRRTDLVVRAHGVGRSFGVETDDEGRTGFILPLDVAAIDVSIGRNGERKTVSVAAGDDVLEVELTE